MFKSIKSNLKEPSIQELLEYAVVDDVTLDTVIESYRSEEDCKLFGYEVEGQITGLIGYRVQEDKGELEILHLAVHPANRYKGYGRALVLLSLTQEEPTSVVAVTDEEGTDFFRSIGFEITGFREAGSTVERFRCLYLVDEPEDE
ncbi:GNAT family N-acetyltransferase [Paenibacillus senegalimassiliensis]|uniref:GNAT family N-acetyltransferase n=1 Tax=Paenibacillus senegalimassiliensis TaxID=1737426 RepID=UPI00073F2976|nr:GNAT family N-acetyltransferase [Paenibacillus senegalimassiliensis]